MSARHEQKFLLMTKLATDVAGLSTCRRAQVGCVIVAEDYSRCWFGYNGPPAGTANDGCNGKRGACGCVHAEANALLKAWSSARSAMLLTTTAPCLACAGLIVQAQRAGVVGCVGFLTGYRSPAGLALLQRAEVPDRTWAELRCMERQR